MNEKDLEICCNFSTKITTSKEKISRLEFTDLETVNLLPSIKFLLFNLKGIVYNIKITTINNKSRALFKLIDIDYKKSINCVFWEIDELLHENFEYEFKNVSINTNDGFCVSRMWCSQIIKLKKSRIKIDLNLLEDLSVTKVVINKIINFEDIEEDKTNFIEILGIYILVIFNIT